MGDVWKAGRKGVACGCRRSERAPQANEPKRSAQLRRIFGSKREEVEAGKNCIITRTSGKN
jgi:hypothetical protein